jgi:surface polysaccharide O-acyltransferase-like enzyme
MSTTTHIRTFDYYRLAAAFAIIVLHLRMQPCPGLNIVNAAVPMFALLSGFLTVQRLPEGAFPLGSAIGRRTARLLVPYAFWTVIYWILNNVWFDVIVHGKNFHWLAMRALLRMVFLGGAAPHLWYLPCLFYAQVVVLCGLRMCRLRRLDEHVFLMLALCVALGGALWLPGATSTVLTGYLRLYFFRLFLFFCLGGLYACYAPAVVSHMKGHQPLLWLLPLCAALGWGFLATGIAQGLIWSHLLIVSALFWWALVRECRGGQSHGSPAGRWDKTVAGLAKMTMGVYLVHVLFTTMAYVAGDKMGVVPFALRPGLLVAACVLVVSLASVWLAGKVPVFRRVMA